MSFGSSKTKTSSVTTPGKADPFVMAGLENARNLLGQGPLKYFGGNTVAGFNPTQEGAFGDIIARAKQGAPGTTQQASDVLSATLRGDYLSPNNPYTSAVSKSVLDGVIPRIQSMFTSAGRTGSNANTQTLTEQATQALAPVLFDQYGRERQNQMSAMMGAPGFADASLSNDFKRFQALLGVGDAQQGMDQQKIDASKKKFDFEQLAPWQLQEMYAGLVNPYASKYQNTNGTQKTTSYGVQVPLAGGGDGAGAGGGGGGGGGITAALMKILGG